MGGSGTALPVFPSGTYYTATDSELLTWVHVTLIDSQLRAYETFVEPLDRGEKDQYCSETAEFASLLKIPRRLLPTCHYELTGHLAKFCHQGPVQVSNTALRLSRDLLYPPGGTVASALLGLGRLVTAGLLPESIRRAYDLPWDEARARRFGAVARVIRRARRLSPRFLRVWAPARRARQASPRGRCPIPFGESGTPWGRRRTGTKLCPDNRKQPVFFPNDQKPSSSSLSDRKKCGNLQGLLVRLLNVYRNHPLLVGV